MDKKDSISVESQLEYCHYETRGRPYIEYTDRGFSGKDTNRPGFERMMADIQAGKIKRVIVYKLDRISRSILDFANMMELFQKYHVEFVSSTEKFDTSTPIGRAMLNICIVFAQLERETIQKRITDAYYARCKRGFYMGGRIPYGYRLKETVIDGIRTSMYEEVPEESKQLKQIYALYADSSNSLGDVIRYLDEHRMKHLRGGNWSSARLSELLRNPIYVQADMDVYRFFQSQGANICNPISDFTGDHACYLYKRTASDAGGTVSDSKGKASYEGKQGALADKEIVLAPHKGIIPSKIWLACRMRCLNNRQSTKTCKPKNSWLSGKVKCDCCGYALTIRKSKTKWGRYFVCSQSGNLCRGAGCTVYADVLEDYIFQAIGKKISEFLQLSASAEENMYVKDGFEHNSYVQSDYFGDDSSYVQSGQFSGNNSYVHSDFSLERNEKKIHLAQIDEEINGLLFKVAGANPILMKYINERIAELDAAKQTLQKELAAEAAVVVGKRRKRITNHTEKWKSLSFEDKQAVVDTLIQVIRIADGSMEIIWRI